MGSPATRDNERRSKPHPTRAVKPLGWLACSESGNKPPRKVRSRPAAGISSNRQRPPVQKSRRGCEKESLMQQEEEQESSGKIYLSFGTSTPNPHRTAPSHKP